jgi:hypothetical protein
MVRGIESVTDNESITARVVEYVPAVIVSDNLSTASPDVLESIDNHDRFGESVYLKVGVPPVTVNVSDLLRPTVLPIEAFPLNDKVPLMTAKTAAEVS